MKKILSFINKYSLLLIITSVLAVIFILDLTNTDRDFSELENKVLKQSPEFSIEALVANEYTLDYEEYINDQFFMRDSWISLKSVAERTLGKIENNGILYGDEGYMFDKFTDADTEQIEKSSAALAEFLESFDGEVVVSIIPNSYAIKSDLMPRYIENFSPFAYLEDINSVDVVTPLMQNSDDYLYFKNDHHWTMEGAYIAYQVIANELSVSPVSLDTLETTTTDGFFGTYYFKSKNAFATADEFIVYDDKDLVTTIGDSVYSGVYDYEAVEQMDKYGGYLYGNNSLCVIENPDVTDGSKLLVIKDSYANIMMPLLAQNFSEVHIIDFRFFNINLSDYIASEEIDKALILYNFKTFTEDNSFVKIRY